MDATRRIRAPLWGATVCAALMVVASVAPADAHPRPGRTDRVSVSSTGAHGTAASGRPSLSGDGRVVAFQSQAPNLVPGDTNGRQDIFVHDRATGVTERVSVGPDGVQANGNSGGASISADGHRIAFWSEATNLAVGDSNGAADVFVHDRTTGITERASVSTSGTEADSYSFVPSLTADGRHVAFAGPASNLVTGDTNGRWDVFVRDLDAGQTERVSVDSDGTEVAGLSNNPAISADGRYVAFQSESALVSEDTNGEWDVYVRDRATGETERASVADDHPILHGVRECPGPTPLMPWACFGTQGYGYSVAPSISSDGRYVAFHSTSDNLVPGDTNSSAHPDVFVRDRLTGVTERISVRSDGRDADGASVRASISADGRYVAFESDVDELVPNDTAGFRDVFVHDRETALTERISVPATAPEANGPSGVASISDDGRHVAFESTAANLLPGGTSGGSDAYVRDLGPSVGVGEVTVTAAEDYVAVSGWSTFSGVTASAADPADDGLPGSETAGAELTGLDLVHHGHRGHLLVRWHVTSLPRIQQGGASEIQYGLELVVEGTPYQVRALRQADRFSPQDSEPRFALYRCDPGCVEEASLTGGIGTAGAEVRVSVPLDLLGASAEMTLEGIRAFTTVDDATISSLVALDEVSLPAFTIGPPQVSLGVAPAGTPEAEVDFDIEATLDEGLFSGTADHSRLPPGDHEVWARACLGAVCQAASAPVSR